MDGAAGESQYIYIAQSGLRQRLYKGNVHLLEIGFGTGLNFALSIQVALLINGGALHYTAFEPNPLSNEELTAFHQGNIPEEILAMLIGKSSVPKPNTLQLTTSGWSPNLSLDERFDIIYYDAFGSEYAPELWTEAAAASIAKLLRPGGTLVTFGVKGEFRRALQAAGLSTERLPGYGRKRQMLRATAIQQ
jgi:tRNA U34 5-methylaminomethyl-2-thiouridine-forming methyltransferase MnmC